MSTIAVIGAGHVGLVTGACLADQGHEVVCIDSDRSRVVGLQLGELPIYEPGLEEIVVRSCRAGRLSFTCDYAMGLARAQLAFIAVNTPSALEGALDSSYVLAATESILQCAPPGLTIVVKSTVPIGTADFIRRLAVDAARSDVQVVSNPEFLREGSAVQDFVHPDRIVIGADSQESATAVAQLFRSEHAPVITCSPRSAELAKYVANALLATRISFMNEIAAISAAAAADIESVGAIIGADHRIGPAFLEPGLGWGGSCLPKDVRALIATAEAAGHQVPILQAVLDVNRQQRLEAFERLRAAVRHDQDATVGVLGLAFKPGTDDIREAPALDVIARLLEEGVHIRAHDPVAMQYVRGVLPNIHYCNDAYAVAAGSHAILLATEWPDYMTLDWRKMRAGMLGHTIVDGRGALDKAELSGLGFTCLTVAAGAESTRLMGPSERTGTAAQQAAIREYPR